MSIILDISVILTLLLVHFSVFCFLHFILVLLFGGGLVFQVSHLRQLFNDVLLQLIKDLGNVNGVLVRLLEKVLGEFTHRVASEIISLEVFLILHNIYNVIEVAVGNKNNNLIVLK